MKRETRGGMLTPKAQLGRLKIKDLSVNVLAGERFRLNMPSEYVHYFTTKLVHTRNRYNQALHSILVMDE